MAQQNRFLQRLEKGIVLGAEGYLFELERRGYLKAGAYVPEVVIEYPNAVKELHRELPECFEVHIDRLKFIYAKRRMCRGNDT